MMMRDYNRAKGSAGRKEAFELVEIDFIIVVAVDLLEQSLLIK